MSSDVLNGYVLKSLYPLLLVFTKKVTGWQTFSGWILLVASLMMNFCLEDHSLDNVMVQISVLLKPSLLFRPISCLN